VSALKQGIVRFSVSSDPDLLEEFDETITRMGYTRSNAVQLAMRGFLTDAKWTAASESKVVGAITMIYDHDVRGIGETLTDVQHHHIEEITSTTHVHLDEDNCLEIIAVRGDLSAIRDLASKLSVTKGVKQLKVAILM
jgi:CopG family nickel-responsive transcriptional regulator